MKPLLYKGCLDLISHRDNLQPSEWLPIMLSDVINMEEELKAEFPKEYEEFLVDVGAGLELGGLAEWFHLDLSVSNNLIEANEALLNKSENNAPPKGFLAIYDCKDGTFFGFQNKNHRYQKEVMYWDSIENIYEKTADSLYLFLEENIDCDEFEIESVQTSLDSLLTSEFKAQVVPKTESHTNLTQEFDVEPKPA